MTAAPVWASTEISAWGFMVPSPDTPETDAASAPVPSAKDSATNSARPTPKSGKCSAMTSAMDSSGEPISRRSFISRLDHSSATAAAGISVSRCTG